VNRADGVLRLPYGVEAVRVVDLSIFNEHDEIMIQAISSCGCIEGFKLGECDKTNEDQRYRLVPLDKNGTWAFQQISTSRFLARSPYSEHENVFELFTSPHSPVNHSTPYIPQQNNSGTEIDSTSSESHYALAMFNIYALPSASVAEFVIAGINEMDNLVLNGKGKLNSFDSDKGDQIRVTNYNSAKSTEYRWAMQPLNNPDTNFEMQVGSRFGMVR
jgi:hypothetical protein